MKWNEAMAGVGVVATAGPADVDICGVQYDSRRVGVGDVFVAMRGGTTDGNRFVEAALSSGAAAVVTDSEDIFARLHKEHPELAIALVEHGRRALAEVSAAAFGHPEKKLKLSAVTGTNGKTTTVLLLEQMLKSVGRKCVLLGTIETHVGDAVRVSEHTTPESRDVLEVFAEGVRAGCTEAVMEMSSHALEQERVWGLAADVAMFTNLTQDHLDFHGTMERYAAAKVRLFTGVGAEAPRVAVINADDPTAEMMMAAARACEVRRYGIEAGEWRAEDVVLEAGRTQFRMRTPVGAVEIASPLTGRVNVYNLLAASCAAHARGLSLEQIAAAAKTLRQVPGRFEVVAGSRKAGFAVVVDYAHTDDALKNLIALARDLVRENGGRVITMFGCGGDRDKTKRPKMGRVAAGMSDFLVVTSDNPRSEEPMQIIEEILVGVRAEQGEDVAEFVVEVDRRTAIGVAIRMAKPRDIVLLAGKGHEKVQIFANETVAFDDVAEAEQVLQM
jgi:UDP-N-acetylmuramoyl-L-alanyl-D-glutamate--2,6-diaminopimelate ligase